MPAPTLLPPLLETAFDSAAFQADPYGHFARYRSEAPVFRNQENVVYLARHADCARLLSDAEFVRTPPGTSHPLGGGQSDTALDRMVAHWMIFMDPPRHGVVRSAFAPLFSAAAVERARRPIEATVRELLDSLPAGGEPVDFVTAFAARVPSAVICDLLGLPREGRPLFHDWCARIAHGVDLLRGEPLRLAVAAAAEMRDYLDAWLRTAAIRESALGPAADALQAEELVYGIAFLAVAGHETTRNVLSGGLLALCGQSAPLGALRRSLDLRVAVEELTRFTAPVQKISRWTSRDCRFGETQIAAGTLVTALLGAANRDPEVFASPDSLDLGRSPNRHLSFGRGAHACLGGGLARAELHAAFAALLERYSRVEVRHSAWRFGSGLRGLESLEVSLR